MESYRRSLGIVRRTGVSLTPATLAFIALLRQEVRRRERDGGLGGAIQSEGDAVVA